MQKYDLDIDTCHLVIEALYFLQQRTRLARVVAKRQCHAGTNTILLQLCIDAAAKMKNLRQQQQ